MATIMNRVKSVPRHLPTGTALHHGSTMSVLKATVVDKGERYGAAAAFGAAKGYYGEKFIWKGHGADLWIGGAALALSVGLEVFAGGRSKIAPHIERIGDAGMMSAISSLATAWGMGKAGRSVAITSPGKNAKLPGRQVVGGIAPAAPGAYLSANDIANFAQRR